ncbi:BlaI/MecI/CopY family transcriptional regulator [Marinigracilibium pacificum]|uniref:BlaI/MecI/CopY family transcriptional regulator n=1 Tax=Marinigracilibium pacificum TaxID=2729599 RepID=A0A848J215_9BACT|nr:BlaI/MecI/CopY family transcriptional regulator [Marinigracilibium pacificum]NMM48514.1 BlaI/MecI/CopY family transcriptional regulator [Marinigracilibium pacificum]
MKELTKAEEQVMNIIWKLEKAFLKDVVEEFPEPKPAYTTISTVMRVLVKKGFVDYRSYSKVHEYFPKISKDEYFKDHIGTVISNFFDGSINKFASFFADTQSSDISELEEVKKVLESKIEELKKKNE